jgi:membrane-associated phospholipid phosphatase
MTDAQRHEKFKWFILIAGYFAAGYLAINRFNLGRPNPIDLAFGFEREIPLVPFFITGYILVYASVILIPFILTDVEDWRRAVVSTLAAMTCAYLFFLLFPIHMELRPPAPEGPGLWEALTRGYFFIDPPSNCFPSLHVTYPMLGTLLVWRHHRVWRWIYVAMTAIVALSVVLVRQHYVADVIGGFVNATLWFWLTVRYGGKLCARVCPDDAD